jgi:hypothetical protein
MLTCYTYAMQPDKPTNYWSPNPEEEEKFDMYQPSNEEVVGQTQQKTATKPVEDDELIRWSAAEYIHQEKNGIWFAVFAVVVLAFIALDIFLLQSYTFSLLVVVMAISVVIYSHRPPRMINYTLSVDQGLYIDETLHHFSEFKSFGIIRDAEHNSIMLVPTKRFAPGVSVYFPIELGEQIVDVLGVRLPMNEVKLDLIDIFIRKIRL